MEFIYDITNSIFGIENIGLAIIVFTILTNVAMIPLLLKQQKSMKINGIIQPEIQSIQKKYKGKTDQKSQIRLQAETQAVYDKYGASMTGGCLTSFITLPIMLGLYRIMDEVVLTHPDVLFCGCSGGGGRFDPAMLYYQPQIWCSDNTDAMDRLRIQYGTSFCYPVCTMGAHVSVVPNEENQRITPMETRGVVAMCGTFGYEMDLGKCTAEEKAVVREQVRTFKERCRLIQEGDYYRLTDPFRNRDYTAWQHVSPDRREALVSLVTGSTWAAKPFLTLRLKGLDPEAFYRVNGGGERYSGAQLMYAGYPIPPQRGDYQAVQLYLEAE